MRTFYTFIYQRAGRLIASALLTMLGFVVMSDGIIPVQVAAQNQASKPMINQSPAQAPMTNQDVIRLVQAKVGDDFVIAKIKQSKTKFDLSTDSIVQLKQAGVSDRVLAVMLNPTADTTEGKSSPPQPTRSVDPVNAKLPTSVGIFYQHGQTYEEIPQETANTRMSTARIITGGLLRNKTEHKVPGKSSKVLIAEGIPRFLIHLPGRDVTKLEMLSVLEVRASERVVFTVEGRVSNNTNRKAVAATMEERGQGYIEIWPKEPLPAGEYAIVDYGSGIDLAANTLAKVWAFTVKR